MTPEVTFGSWARAEVGKRYPTPEGGQTPPERLALLGLIQQWEISRTKLDPEQQQDVLGALGMLAAGQPLPPPGPVLPEPERVWGEGSQYGLTCQFFRLKDQFATIGTKGKVAEKNGLRNGMIQMTFLDGSGTVTVPVRNTHADITHLVRGSS